MSPAVTRLLHSYLVFRYECGELDTRLYVCIWEVCAHAPLPLRTTPFIMQSVYTDIEQLQWTLYVSATTQLWNDSVDAVAWRSVCAPVTKTHR